MGLGRRRRPTPLDNLDTLSTLPQKRGTYEYVLSRTARMLFGSEEEQQDPMFRYVLHTEDRLYNFASTRGIKFAPGLLDMLKSSRPPTIHNLKKLPQLPQDCKIWAVYLLVLEWKPKKKPKEGSGAETEAEDDGQSEGMERKFKIYIGSGTETISGLKTRFGQYDKGTTIPKEIWEALKKQGYEITYRGILCWTPLPQDGDQLNFRTRVLLTALEASLSIMLWSMVGTDQDEYKMPVRCPWDVSQLPYEGCCTHVSLTEVVRGEEKAFTPEELKIVVAVRKTRSRQRKKDSVKRRTDSGVIAVTAKGVRHRAKTSGRFPCCLCAFNGKDRSALRRHNNRSKHVEALENLAKRLSEAASRRNAPLALSTSLGVFANMKDTSLVRKINSKLVELVQLAENHAGKDEVTGRTTYLAKFARLVECATCTSTSLRKTRSRCKLAKEKVQNK